MTGCADILAERISKTGPISFRDFMETALYDPKEGYYSVRAAIGEGGDFTTAPSISPLFARAVARAFAADAGSFEGPIDFVEVAAGEGIFLRDFRRELAEVDPSAARRTRIRAVERSARGRESIVRSGGAERVFADASQLEKESISGWIFSNELYDALPVHRVQMREGRALRAGGHARLVGQAGSRALRLGKSSRPSAAVRFPSGSRRPACAERSRPARLRVDILAGSLASFRLPRPLRRRAGGGPDRGNQSRRRPAPSGALPVDPGWKNRCLRLRPPRAGPLPFARAAARNARGALERTPRRRPAGESRARRPDGSRELGRPRSRWEKRKASRRKRSVDSRDSWSSRASSRTRTATRSRRCACSIRKASAKRSPFSFSRSRLRACAFFHN